MQLPTIPDLLIAADLNLGSATQNLVLSESILLPGDFTIYVTGHTVAGKNWGAIGGRKSMLTIGARNGEPTVTMDGFVRMSGGALLTGSTLLRVTREDDVVKLQCTGGTSLTGTLGVQLGKVDQFNAAQLANVLNNDPAIRARLPIVIGRYIALDSTEDLAIRAAITAIDGAGL